MYRNFTFILLSFCMQHVSLSFSLAEEENLVDPFSNEKPLSFIESTEENSLPDHLDFVPIQNIQENNSLPPLQKTTVPKDDKLIIKEEDESKKEDERTRNQVAQFSALDKITAHITNFDVYMNETFQFGNLQITPRACYSGSILGKPKTDVFVEIDTIRFDKKIKRIFTGWMFAESVGLSSLDDPIYDIWLKDCKQQSEIPPFSVPDFPPYSLRKSF